MNGLNENNLQELSSMFEQYEAPFSADELQADWQQVASKITSLPQGASSATSGAGTSGFLGSFGFKAIIGLVTIAAITGLILINTANEPIIAEKPETNESLVTYSELANDKKSFDNAVLENAGETESKKEQFGNSTNTTFNKPAGKPNTTLTGSANNSLKPEVTEKPEVDHTPIASESNNKSAIDKLQKAQAKISRSEICQNERVFIKITNPNPDFLYIFQLEDAKSGKTFDQGSIENNRSIRLEAAGNFNLVLTEIAESKSRELLNEPILVREKPKAKMVFEKNACNQYSFESKSLGAADYTWLMPDKILTGKTVQYNFAKDGFEKVTLIAQNNYCADSITKEVFANSAHAGKAEIEVANIFTPNGDGNNDLFELMTKNPHLALKKGTIEVYNQQNDLVFKSISGLSDAWNGKLMNVGNDCESGIYTYVIACENSCNPAKMDYITGVISIAR